MIPLPSQLSEYALLSASFRTSLLPYLDTARLMAANVLDSKDAEAIERIRQAVPHSDPSQEDLSRLQRLVEGFEKIGLMDSVRLAFWNGSFSSLVANTRQTQLILQLKSERARITFFAARDQEELCQLTVALVDIAYALQILGETDEAGHTYASAMARTGDILEGPRREKIALFCEERKKGLWDDHHYQDTLQNVELEYQVLEIARQSIQGEWRQALQDMVSVNVSFHGARARALAVLCLIQVQSTEGPYWLRELSAKALTGLPPSALDARLFEDFRMAGYQVTAILDSRDAGGHFVSRPSLRIYRGRHYHTGTPVVIRWIEAECQSAQKGAQHIHTLGNDHDFPKELVRVFEIGSLEGGSYAVMECAEGELLIDKLIQGPQESLGFLASLLEQLLTMESYLNSKGLVHGDLSPFNMKTTEQRLKVFDYEHTKHTRGSHDEKDSLQMIAGIIARYFLRFFTERFNQPVISYSQRDIVEMLSPSKLFTSLHRTQQDGIAVFLMGLVNSPGSGPSYPNAAAALKALAWLRPLLTTQTPYQTDDLAAVSYREVGIHRHKRLDFLEENALLAALKTTDGSVQGDSLHVRTMMAQLESQTDMFEAHEVRADLKDRSGLKAGSVYFYYIPDRQDRKLWQVHSFRVHLEQRGQYIGHQMYVGAIRYHYQNPRFNRFTLTGIQQGRFLLRHFDGIRLSAYDLAQIGMLNELYGLGLPREKIRSGLTTHQLALLPSETGWTSTDSPVVAKVAQLSGRNEQNFLLSPGESALFLLPRLTGTLDLTEGNSDFTAFEASIHAFRQARRLAP